VSEDDKPGEAGIKASGPQLREGYFEELVPLLLALLLVLRDADGIMQLPHLGGSITPVPKLPPPSAARLTCAGMALLAESLNLVPAAPPPDRCKN